MIPLVIPHSAIAPQSSPYSIGEMPFVAMGVAVTFELLIRVGANVAFPRGGLGASPAITRVQSGCAVAVVPFVQIPSEAGSNTATKVPAIARNSTMPPQGGRTTRRTEMRREGYLHGDR